MVAAHGGNLAAADEFKAFGRIGVIAHNIAQAVNGIALKLFYILHHRFQSGQIGMDVTNQGYSTHGIVSKEHSTLGRFCQARLLTGNHGWGQGAGLPMTPYFRLFDLLVFCRRQRFQGFSQPVYRIFQGIGQMAGHQVTGDLIRGKQLPEGDAFLFRYVQPVFQNKNITHQAGCPVAGILE